jgi:hypothetical protein
MERRSIQGREYIVRDLDTEPKTLMEELQEILTEEYQNRLDYHASRAERRARLEAETVYLMGVDESSFQWSHSIEIEDDIVAWRVPAGEEEMIVSDEELADCVQAAKTLADERLRAHADENYRVTMVEGI